MSGLEAVGVAASIIQVADLSAKLSVKLFSFYRQVKHANDGIQLLSNEIALVSATLRELGDNLKDEESAKLCSEHAFYVLRLVLDQCRDVLGQIQKVVDSNDQMGKNRFQQTAGKIRVAFLEPNLDQLKTKLESLKSTMLLVLNVIMYAGQLRSNNVPSLVQEQRDLIQNLIQDGQMNGQKPQQPDKTNESPRGFSTQMEPKGPADDGNSEFSHQSHDPFGDQSTLKSQSLQSLIDDLDNRENDTQIQVARVKSGKGSTEFQDYLDLMGSLFDEIRWCESELNHARHSRIKNGVLNIHSGEIMRYQLEEGLSIEIDPSLFIEKTHDETVAVASGGPFRSTETTLGYETDDEPRRDFRQGATNNASSASRTRPNYNRDYEIVMSQGPARHEQRHREKPDFSQDMAIWKQQQEIDRLERELEKERSKAGRPREEWDRDDAEKQEHRQSSSVDAPISDPAVPPWHYLEEAGSDVEEFAQLEDAHPLTGPVTESQDDDTGRLSDNRTFDQQDGDFQKPAVSRNLSLPGNLEDLLAQWTTLDKQEIQRGHVAM